MFRPQQSSARHLLQQHWYPVPQCCLRPLSQTLGLWDGWDLNLLTFWPGKPVFFVLSRCVTCVCVFVSAGKCISHFTNRKVPYCVKFNPDEDKQNLFVAGMSDKKIVQVNYVDFDHMHLVPVPAAAWNKPESRFPAWICVEEVLEGVSNRWLPVFVFLYDTVTPHPLTLHL